MSPTLLLLLPPFAFLLWRPDWPTVAALLGAMALVAYLDWSAHKTDWNGSVSVDIDHANHAIKTLRAEVDSKDKEAREAMALVLQNLEPLNRRTKALEESVEGHSRALQQALSKPKNIL